MYQLLDKKFHAGALFILLLLIACTASNSKQERVATGVTPDTISATAKNNKPQPVNSGPQSGLPKQKEYKTCDALITDLVKSSNAAALNSFKAVQVRIDEVSPGKITVELYTVNEVSEDPAIERMAERTVGWLEFFPDTRKLQDITNDPEEPHLLKYDTRILQKTDVAKLCLSTD